MTVATVEWDPFAHSGLDDPFATYRALRETHPVYHNADRDVWALTRFDDVQRAARDWRTFSNAAGVDLDDTTEVFGPGNFIDSDPRRHDELRGLVRHPFTPTAVAELERGVRRRARDLLAPLIEAGGGDIAKALAWPLPVATICDLVGFPIEDASRLQRWVAAAIDRVPGEGRTPGAARAAVSEMHAYFAELAAERRRRQHGDLLGVMATEEVGGAPLTTRSPGSARCSQWKARRRPSVCSATCSGFSPNAQSCGSAWHETRPRSLRRSRKSCGARESVCCSL